MTRFRLELQRASILHFTFLAQYIITYIGPIRNLTLTDIAATMAPTFLFVPGHWEGSAPFSYVASLLQAQDYPTEIATLPSTGTVSPHNPSMNDDILAIRSTVSNLVNDSQQVVLVLHSALAGS